ncbi:hypothetical protein BAUCODRAFT_148281 [Baudoinia panamericana UAMH 10762]|uniref:Uncharacterized protein n=1 Tax=Baudoinia panamericana (strain UAMH 10762) TaxID=717646 RepID=M2LQK9_BAUPA|nr:uncharacterized protein BAUCODRAFT_148281 [Baudoinia panamericana UAMH 10762]EMC96717.1 hypothetical protein BAUCODRAFT_148281 [Baudoinia panamericana UAMH 10762]
MFCLRAWVLTLIFLTNAAPIYIALFLTATYLLQRPCVYCSILLFVLVFSLFDFQVDWFEPRWRPSQEQLTSVSEALSGLISGNATVTDAIVETASLAVSAINGTGGSIASAAMEGVKRRLSGGHTSPATTGFEWLRGILEKKQFRIPCVDVVVRL